ncbi:MAG: hypothetical protein GY903_14080 [Fuerstiella sp.]|nr:hypothetical protein [Fuerstiella sp.]MCP4855615.1 hypothetical protein [Fuerstiella sp.]
MCVDIKNFSPALIVPGIAGTVHNPAGPDSSFDPQEPGIIKRVQQGGRSMCGDQYCIGHRVSARMKGEEDTGAFHTGFRCVVNPETASAR